MEFDSALPPPSAAAIAQDVSLRHASEGGIIRLVKRGIGVLEIRVEAANPEVEAPDKNT